MWLLDIPNQVGFLQIATVSFSSVRPPNTQGVCTRFISNLFQQKTSLSDPNHPASHRHNTEGAQFVVHRQPIALDRFTIHDVRPPDTSSGAYNAGASHHFISFDLTATCIYQADWELVYTWLIPCAGNRMQRKIRGGKNALREGNIFMC